MPASALRPPMESHEQAFRRATWKIGHFTLCPEVFAALMTSYVVVKAFRAASDPDQASVRSFSRS